MLWTQRLAISARRLGARVPCPLGGECIIFVWTLLSDVPSPVGTSRALAQPVGGLWLRRRAPSLTLVLSCVGLLPGLHWRRKPVTLQQRRQAQGNLAATMARLRPGITGWKGHSEVKCPRSVHVQHGACARDSSGAIKRSSSGGEQGSELCRVWGRATTFVCVDGGCVASEPGDLPSEDAMETQQGLRAGLPQTNRKWGVSRKSRKQ